MSLCLGAELCNPHVTCLTSASLLHAYGPTEEYVGKNGTAGRSVRDISRCSRWLPRTANAKTSLNSSLPNRTLFSIASL